jgi:small subunit ribosomal protein S16
LTVVRIRMKAMGRRHRPFFRICAMDSRTPRDGRAIEELGWYDPLVRDPANREKLDASRIRYWLSVGAQPSEKVAAILKRHKIAKPAPGEPWQLPEPAPQPAPTPADGGAEAPAQA